MLGMHSKSAVSGIFSIRKRWAAWIWASWRSGALVRARGFWKEQHYYNSWALCLSSQSLSFPFSCPGLDLQVYLSTRIALFAVGLVLQPTGPMRREGAGKEPIAVSLHTFTPFLLPSKRIQKLWFLLIPSWPFWPFFNILSFITTSPEQRVFPYPNYSPFLRCYTCRNLWPPVLFLHSLLSVFSLIRYIWDCNT